MIIKLVDRVIRDQDGNIIIWQWPNLPLWVWIVCFVLGFWLRGSAHTIVSSAGTAALLVWAGLEIGWGSSWFRRGLGAAVLLSILMGYFL